VTLERQLRQARRQRLLDELEEDGYHLNDFRRASREEMWDAIRDQNDNDNEPSYGGESTTTPATGRAAISPAPWRRTTSTSASGRPAQPNRSPNASGACGHPRTASRSRIALW